MWYFPFRHPNSWNTSGNSSSMLSHLCTGFNPSFHMMPYPQGARNFLRPLENKLVTFPHASRVEEVCILSYVGNGRSQGTEINYVGGRSINAYFLIFSLLFWAISLPTKKCNRCNFNANMFHTSFYQATCCLQTVANFTFEQSVQACMRTVSSLGIKLWN